MSVEKVDLQSVQPETKQTFQGKKSIQSDIHESHDEEKRNAAKLMTGGVLLAGTIAAGIFCHKAGVFQKLGKMLPDEVSNAANKVGSKLKDLTKKPIKFEPKKAISTDVVREEFQKGTIPNVMTREGWLDLINSKEAETFIKAAQKQDAKILSDSIIPLGETGQIGLYRRVITKRMPDGKLITQSFDFSGLREQEIISKTSRKAIHHGAGCSGGTAFVKVNKGGSGIMRNYPLNSRGMIKSFPSGSIPKNPWTEHAEGLTDLVNAENQSYQTLKRLGLVANPSCAYK